jgi:hypothetical protein
MPGKSLPEFRMPLLKGRQTTLCSPLAAATVRDKWSEPFSDELVKPNPIAAAARRFSYGKKRFSISSVLDKYWISSAIALEIEIIILDQQQCGTALSGCIAAVAWVFVTVH